MELLSFTLLIVVGASVYYYYKKKLSYFKNRGVPYKPGLPIFGSMISVVFRVKDMSQLVGEVYRAYPYAKYVGIFNFGQPAIVLRDPELIKMITIKNFDRFQNHSLAIDEKLDPFLSKSLFHIKGERWREARSLFTPIFTSSKLKSMFKLMLECSKNFNNYLFKLSDEEMKQLSTKDLFTKYTTDVVAPYAFGVSVNSLDDPKNDFYVLGLRGAIFEGLIMFKFYMCSMMPSLMKLFNIRVIDEEIARFFRRTVSEVIEAREKEGISRPDIIQLMMDSRNSGSGRTKLDNNAITGHAFGFFIGSFDTTSSQMCIIAHELAMNPGIQEKLQNEIDKVREEMNGELSYEAIRDDMPYLDAVFYESLRRHTEIVILDRVCEKPLELPPALPGSKPFTIQPGMMVWISGKSIHMDPDYYENPEKFDPERYYKKKITTNDELNLAFGIGPRACIGFRFAILETKILFFHLLSEFTLVANERTNLLAGTKDHSVAIKRRNT